MQLLKFHEMVSSEFREFLSSVKEKLGEGTFQSEAAVSMMIVLPVLRHLGWPTDNPSYVFPEYPLETRKVDFGLKISEGIKQGLRCIIEVKAVGNIIDADRQLFEYAFHAGTPLAVLTDGKLWKFYLPLAVGEHKERLVRTLDIEEHSPEELVKGLARYMSFDNTRSGRAKENAESDLSERIDKEKAKESISVAWENLLNGSSDKLVTLLVEETSQISSGYAPARSDVEEFIKSLKNAEPKSRNISRKKRQEPKSKKLPHKSSKEVQFLLLGEKYTESNAVNAYVRIIEILAGRDKDFIARLAPKTKGRKNQWLSRNLEDMRSETVREISPGWWLDTHVSNKGKIGRLKTACEVARISFGKPRGLKIVF